MTMQFSEALFRNYWNNTSGIINAGECIIQVYICNDGGNVYSPELAHRESRMISNQN